MSTVYRLILYARLLYSLILVNYYNNIPQDMMVKSSNLDPDSEALEELDGIMRAVYNICKAATYAFSGFFKEVLTSDPTFLLSLRKFDFYVSLINAITSLVY